MFLLPRFTVVDHLIGSRHSHYLQLQGRLTKRNPARRNRSAVKRSSAGRVQLARPQQVEINSEPTYCLGMPRRTAVCPAIGKKSRTCITLCTSGQ